MRNVPLGWIYMAKLVATLIGCDDEDVPPRWIYMAKLVATPIGCDDERRVTEVDLYG